MKTSTLRLFGLQNTMGMISILCKTIQTLERCRTSRDLSPFSFYTFLNPPNPLCFTCFTSYSFHLLWQSEIMIYLFVRCFNHFSYKVDTLCLLLGFYTIFMISSNDKLVIFDKTLRDREQSPRYFKVINVVAKAVSGSIVWHLTAVMSLRIRKVAENNAYSQRPF